MSSAARLAVQAHSGNWRRGGLARPAPAPYIACSRCAIRAHGRPAQRHVPQEARVTSRLPQRPGRQLQRWLHAAPAAVCATLLGACGGTVEVRQAFPPPLVARLPLRVAVHYPPSLTAYVHREKGAAQQGWSVSVGTANVRMFDAVFTALFSEVIRIGSLDDARTLVPAPDAIIQPALAAYELSPPALSATEQFAVWLRFDIDVLATDGARLFSWPVTGYGQAGTGGMSDEQAVERATVLALRDAAATIAVEFANQPQVRRVLLDETARDAQ